MWFILSLSTAIFTSFSDVLRKKSVAKVNVYVVAWGWRFFALLACLTAIPFTKPPQFGPAFFWTLAGIVVCIVSTTLWYIKSLQLSDLSMSVPMLAFSPLFLLITSPLIVGEFPRPLGIIGILAIISGSYILNVGESRNGYLGPFKALIENRGTKFMLLVAMVYSIGANIEKIGVLNSSPLYFLVISEAIASTILFFIMIKKVPDAFVQIRKNLKYFLLMGVFEGIGMICQLSAYRLAIVPYVIAIKRTSVIWSSLLGFVIFKEGGIKNRLIAILFMIFGVFLIVLS